MIWVHVITPIVTSGFRVTALPAPDGCKVTNAQIKLGPASIESAVDEVLAAPGVVEAAIKAESDGAQAVVIDCMLDPGLDAAREAVSIPVIGCGEAAMRSVRVTAVAGTITGAKRAVQGGATSIIFGCTGMLGFAGEVRAALDGVKVIDPLPNAIEVAHRAVQNEEKTDKAVYPYPDTKPVEGFAQWAALNALMTG